MQPYVTPIDNRIGMPKTPRHIVCPVRVTSDIFKKKTKTKKVGPSHAPIPVVSSACLRAYYKHKKVSGYFEEIDSFVR